jgi:hypothetical protein
VQVDAGIFGDLSYWKVFTLGGERYFIASHGEGGYEDFVQLRPGYPFVVWTDGKALGVLGVEVRPFVAATGLYAAVFFAECAEKEAAFLEEYAISFLVENWVFPTFADADFLTAGCWDGVHPRILTVGKPLVVIAAFAEEGDGFAVGGEAW